MSNRSELSQSRAALRGLLMQVVTALGEKDPAGVEPFLVPAAEALASYRARLAGWLENREVRRRAAARFGSVASGIDFLSSEGNDAARSLHQLLKGALPEGIELSAWGRLLDNIEGLVAAHGAATGRREKAGIRQSIELALYDLEDMVSAVAGTAEDDEVTVDVEFATPELDSAELAAIGSQEEVSVRESSWRGDLNGDVLNGLQVDESDVDDDGEEVELDIDIDIVVGDD